MNIKSIGSKEKAVTVILNWTAVITILAMVYTFRATPGFFDCFIYSAVWGALIAIRLSQVVSNGKIEFGYIPMSGALFLAILYLAVREYGEKGFLVAALALVGGFGSAWLACHGLRKKRADLILEASPEKTNAQPVSNN